MQKASNDSLCLISKSSRNEYHRTGVMIVDMYDNNKKKNNNNNDLTFRGKNFDKQLGQIFCTVLKQ